MAGKSGPKHKVSRREGTNLTGTGSATLQRRLSVPPGGIKSTRRRTSDYATSLRVKQRVKKEYAMTETQFQRFFEIANRMPGNTGENLVILLEQRLDNVVYRLGFAHTRPMARQLVTHDHIRVNGRPINIPSFLVKPGDRIQLDETMTQRREENGTNGAVMPPWLTVENNVGQVTGAPRREDLDPDIRENLIVEFYAR